MRIKPYKKFYRLIKTEETKFIEHNGIKHDLLPIDAEVWVERLKPVMLSKTKNPVIVYLNDTTDPHFIAVINLNYENKPVE